jgi:hypothetical protein
VGPEEVAVNYYSKMTKPKFKFQEPPPATPYNFLSLGAGVQSSAMALMAAHGEIEPVPDCAIFADTQDEPQSVYDWLDWLIGTIASSSHPFPVEVVTKGRLSDRALEMRVTKDGRKFSKTDIPVFTKNKDGKQGMVPNRSCTADYKIAPIRKKVKELAGIRRGQKEVTVTQWIGISWDEIQRMKESRDKWSKNRWPLIEKQISRRDCIEWMKNKGYPEPPRSSCVYCPFHSDAEWRRLKADHPEDFQKAVQFDRKLREAKKNTDNFRSEPYLHASLKPLDQVDFSTDFERGQLALFADWNDECEGICGV